MANLRRNWKCMNDIKVKKVSINNYYIHCQLLFRIILMNAANFRFLFQYKLSEFNWTSTLVFYCQYAVCGNVQLSKVFGRTRFKIQSFIQHRIFFFYFFPFITDINENSHLQMFKWSFIFKYQPDKLRMF